MFPDSHAALTSQRYSLLAQSYIDHFGTVEQATAEDRAAISAWSGQVRGAVLDAGCGPGHWTKFVAAPERPGTGVDLVPEFLERARQMAPECTFLQAELSQLPCKAEEFSGLLSWYSVIHTPPRELPRILAEFHRVLENNGQLLLGFFAAEKLEAFDHKVAPAWSWPPAQLRELVVSAGFTVVSELTRASSGARCHGELTARKLA